MNLDDKLIKTTNSWTTKKNRGIQSTILVVFIVGAGIIGALLSILE